jgi:hypothetical protein
VHLLVCQPSDGVCVSATDRRIALLQQVEQMSPAAGLSDGITVRKCEPSNAEEVGQVDQVGNAGDSASVDDSDPKGVVATCRAAEVAKQLVDNRAITLSLNKDNRIREDQLAVGSRTVPGQAARLGLGQCRKPPTQLDPVGQKWQSRNATNLK